MDIVKLIHPPLSVEEVVEMVKSAESGAISVFIGTTRNNFQGLEVRCLKYEAYEDMAIRQMQKICHDIRARWPNISKIAIYHRLGEVKISEASVIIAISSPHRADSLEAVNYAIDMLKSCVTIWKKEEYMDFPGEWKVNKECFWQTNSNCDKN